MEKIEPATPAAPGGQRRLKKASPWRLQRAVAVMGLVGPAIGFVVTGAITAFAAVVALAVMLSAARQPGLFFGALLAGLVAVISLVAMLAFAKRLGTMILERSSRDGSDDHS